MSLESKVDSQEAQRLSVIKQTLGFLQTMSGAALEAMPVAVISCNQEDHNPTARVTTRFFHSPSETRTAAKCPLSATGAFACIRLCSLVLKLPPGSLPLRAVGVRSDCA